MTQVQAIEKEVKRLNRPSLAAFRDWFRRFDADAWDRQIEKDAHAGKLSSFAREALSAHKAGKTRPI